jgi:multiple sugar transport system substrate-binding protein/sn-glycerol 3-phosphate transport system substrate-binding protein
MEWSAIEGQVLEFWYVWDLDEPGAGMNAIVDQFNQENEWGITVVPRDQGLVLDPMASVETAFDEGQLPQIMVLDSSVIAEWYQSDLIVDLIPFLEDPAAGMPGADQAAFYPGLIREFLLEGLVRPAMPFSQSIQVIYYNKTWAEELEIDSRPGMAEELWEQSCQHAGEEEPAGLIFSPQAANILSFMYAYRGDPVVSVSGDYHFSSRKINEVARDLRELFQEGCGRLISNYPNPMAIEEEYERFNQRQALMIMGSSLMQEHIQVGEDQNGQGDNWQMLAFPGPDGTKAVTSQVQSVVIFNSTPETELASWLFLKYLTSPEVQAEWAQYSGYYPTRKDSLPFLGEYRMKNPAWASGLDLLDYGRSAPLHPSWQIVKLAVEDAFEELLANPEVDLEAQLETLDQVVDELLEWSEE